MSTKDGIQLDHVAFIGRTHFEYMRMFDLDESVFQKGAVPDCPAGPSSFTAEACKQGFNVLACDLLYGNRAEKLLSKGRDDIAHVFEKVDAVPHLYVWKYYSSRNEIIELRHNGSGRQDERLSVRQGTNE